LTQSDPLLADLIVADIRRQIAAEWSQWIAGCLWRQTADLSRFASLQPVLCN